MRPVLADRGHARNRWFLGSRRGRGRVVFLLGFFASILRNFFYVNDYIMGVDSGLYNRELGGMGMGYGNCG